MPTTNFTTLRDTADKILDVFVTAGYEPVQLPILQPANVFLDVMGEAVRSRAYVVQGADGEELCLRPDLTVPTCRAYLAQAKVEGEPRRASYAGPIFRFDGGETAHADPTESHQAGIENFGSADADDVDAVIVRIVLDGLRAAGLKRLDLRIGDLTILKAILDGIAMPERWRRQLMRLYAKPAAFERQLQLYTAPTPRRPVALPAHLVKALEGTSTETAEEALAEVLATPAGPLIGNRTLGEIATRLKEQLDDASLPRLAPAAKALIEGFIKLGPLPPANVASTVGTLVKPLKLDVTQALTHFETRRRSLAKNGVDMSESAFHPAIGRGFEYYTGFVFEVGGGRDAAPLIVASGGRYDGLLKAVGASRNINAVGAAIYIERLLQAVRG